MSTSSEITRIITARDSLRSTGVALGVSIPTDNITQLATGFATIVNKGAVSLTVKEGESVDIPAGYHNGSGTVAGVAGDQNYTLQDKTVTPTKSTQNITSDSGYFGLSSVTVTPIPANYQDVSSVTATVADVLVTKTFVPSSGTLTTGTMANNGAIAGTINGLAVTSYTVPAGYHSGIGSVSLTNDIELALAAV